MIADSTALFGRAPLAISFLSMIVAALDCLISWRSTNDQDRKSRQRGQWYDPIRDEIRRLQQIARQCRELRGSISSQAEAKAILAKFTTRQHEVTIACRGADLHRRTNRPGWVEHAENEAQKIHDFIANHDPLSAVANSTRGLDEVIQDHVTNLDRRLRDQRISMNPEVEPRKGFLA